MTDGTPPFQNELLERRRYERRPLLEASLPSCAKHSYILFLSLCRCSFQPCEPDFLHLQSRSKELSATLLLLLLLLLLLRLRTDRASSMRIRPLRKLLRLGRLEMPLPSTCRSPSSQLLQCALDSTGSGTKVVCTIPNIGTLLGVVYVTLYGHFGNVETYGRSFRLQMVATCAVLALVVVAYELLW